MEPMRTAVERPIGCGRRRPLVLGNVPILRDSLTYIYNNYNDYDFIPVKLTIEKWSTFCKLTYGDDLMAHRRTKVTVSVRR